jgi:hypothetical protein
MGYDIYFTSVAESAQTPRMNISYNYNAYYKFFDIPRWRGKTGAEMIDGLKIGISELKRMHHTLATTKDPLNPTPGNYSNFLHLILGYATQHPSWTFYCE